MTKNTSITLGEHWGGFIDQQIAAGRFGSASEAVRAGLRLLEEREIKIAALRRAIEEGEGSGPAETFDRKAFLADMRAKHGGDV